MKTKLTQEIARLIDGSESMQPSDGFAVMSTKEEWNHIHLRMSLVARAAAGSSS